MLDDLNSVFEDSFARGDASISMISESTVVFDGTRFINNGAKRVGNIYVESFSNITLSNVIFERSYSDSEISCIAATESAISIKNSTFTLFSTTAIMASVTDNFLDI